MSNKQLITTVGIGLAAASAGMLTRKTLQKSWEKPLCNDCKRKFCIPR